MQNIVKEGDIYHLSMTHNYDNHNLQKDTCDHKPIPR